MGGHQLMAGHQIFRIMGGGFQSMVRSYEYVSGTEEHTFCT